MFKKLFVGGLPFTYSQGELEALFAGLGKVVSAEMVFDPDRGRTRGFGFVEMSTPEEALAAIAALNGKQVGEKKIYVTEARERKSPPPAATGQTAATAPTRKVLNRKLGRPLRGRPKAAYPAWPPPARGSAQDSRGSSRTPGTFGSAPRKGFSRPAKWEPRGDGKRSFSSPRNERGDFGPSDRRPGRRPSKPTDSSKPPKKEFWRKFQKKQS